MKAETSRIVEYFNGSQQNVIPLFQRPYSWKRRNWEALWDDIVDCAEPGGPPVHFLGAVVSAPLSLTGVGVNKYQIIDGQQRLTTFALLLAAMRDAADEALRGKIEDLLVNRHERGGDRLKLVPTQTDREAFRCIVDGEECGERTRIREAYEFFLGRLLPLKETPGRVSHLFDTAWRSLQAVAIGLDGKDDDPYLIFESLNHKGQPLTQADLIRNNVLMRFEVGDAGGGEQDEIYRNLWQPLEAAVAEKEQTEFLRHFGQIGGADVRNASIYTSYKERFDGLPDLEAVRDELSRMLRMADAYARMLDPEREPDGDRRRSFAALRDAKQTTPYPLLLALAEASANGIISEREHTAAVQWVESFVIRRLVCNVPTNALRRIFLFCCRGLAEVARGQAPEPAPALLRRRLLMGDRGNRWPDDAEFREAFVTQDQYGRKSDLVVLKRLEAAEDHKEPVETDSLSIEHVMPQTMTDHWREALGEDADDAHREHRDRFGNLTLTAKGYNSQMSNRSFEEKKRVLATSHVELNRWIVRQPEWGTDEIDERGRHLADVAVRLWPRPDMPPPLAAEG